MDQGQKPIFTSGAASVMNSRRNRPSRPIGSSNFAPASYDASSNSVPTDMFMDTPPAPAPKKRSNKGLIIGILVILIAIVSVAAALLFVKPSSTPADNTTQSVNLPAFNRFANYILTGSDSAEPITATSGDNAFFYTAISDDSTRNTYLQKGSTLLDTFVKEFNGDSRVKDQPVLSNDVKYLQVYYNALVQTLPFEEYPTGDLIALLLSDGLNGAIDKVKAHYAPLTDSGNNASKEYANRLISAATAQLQLYDRYNNNGCIRNGQFVVSCTSNVDTSDLDETLEKGRAARVSAMEMKQSLGSSVISMIFTINNSLLNPKVEEGNE